ncbi:MAG: phage tail tape measure protein [Oscillospiraceae bacterium]|nr:phage tail tape measure protein [Oscillospiraceae bacterium]
MASQRQYEMLFQLNAKLGSQYSSTLKAAQSELLKFNQEYRNLSATANDISAYQRQQTAVENTKDKLALLQQQYDNIQKEMQETGTYSSDLENKLLAKKAQIDKTTKAYNDQIAKLDEYKRRLQEAGVDTTELDKESERLKNELKQLQASFDGAGDEAKEFGDKGAQSVDAIATMLAAAGITKMLKEIYNAFSECVTVAADFESQMSTVEAISGADAEEILALAERAKDLGAATAFTAQQVGEGMEYMAMAGWKTEDMLAGMDSVLALAAASGEDLGTVSDIVTDALTAFGLKASDTGRFADILAQTAANANTNVGMMGETFKYAAPVAGALGYSVEDVAVAIGLMANSGIKASQAGTTLKNIFNGILGGVDLTAAAFGDLNVEFVNSDGSMQDLSSSMDTLRYYFDQMTEAEKVHNAINIAGQRGYAGLLAILNSTTEDYNKLTDAVNNSAGAAQKMADIKMDNLNGQMTIAKSALEGLEIEIGRQFTPMLTKLYKIGADILGSLTTFVKEHPNVVKAVAAGAAVIGVFTAAIIAAKVAMIALNAVMSINPIVLATMAFVALYTAIAVLITTAEDATDPMNMLTGASQEQREEMERLQEEYDQVCEAEGETSANAILLKNKLDEATAAFEENRQTMGEWKAQHDKLMEEQDASTARYNEAAAGIDKEAQSMDSLIFKLMELSNKTELSYGELQILQAVIDEINKRMPEAGLAFDVNTGQLNVTAEQLHEMAEAAAAAKRNELDLQTYLEKVAAHPELEADLEQARKNVEEYRKIYEEAKAAYEAHEDTSSDEHTDWTAYQLSEAYFAAKKHLDELNAEYQESADKLAENERMTAELEDRMTSYGETVAEATAAEEERAAAVDAVANIVGSYTERIETLTEAYGLAYQAAYDSITGQYKLWDDVAEVSAKSVDDVTTSLQNQAKYWSDYNTNIQTLLGYSGEIEGLSGMVAEFGDGSADSVNMIAGMAEAANSGHPEKIQEMVEAWQANKTAQDEAAQSLGDLVTNYSENMAEIQSELAADVEAMDYSDEAYAAATSTLQSFIDGANDMLPAVQRAYESVASAATNALTRSYYRNYYSYRGNERGYASGTDNATPGWHLVGENGPEVRWFNGGESVWDASQTRDFLQAMRRDPLEAAQAPSGGASIQVSFAPQYNLSGASDSAEIRAMLAEHDEEMKRQIRDMLAEEAEDMVRRRM